MPEVSNYAACAIERDFIYIAQILDTLKYPSRFARMSFFLGENATVPWMAHDLQWRVESVCVWRDCPFGGRVYVALSWDGDVELLGPSEQPRLLERIVDRITKPGNNLPTPSQLFGMTIIRQIGHRLYASGGGRHVYRRDGEGWEPIGQPAWAMQAADQDISDINGSDEDHIYAVGSESLTTYRISFFDGVAWRELATGLRNYLTSVSVSGNGGVFITGWSGLLLFGDHQRGFAQVGTNRLEGVNYRAVEFNGLLYIANQTGLFTNAGPDQPIRRAVTGLDPELTDTTMLDVADGTLWCFGRKDLAFFDGRTWRRVHDPDNPRIGR